MKNWKRIIAAAGTAALLISNLGSLSQVTFATEAIVEQTGITNVSEPDADEETDDEGTYLSDLEGNKDDSKDIDDGSGDSGDTSPEDDLNEDRDQGSDEGAGEDADQDDKGDAGKDVDNADDENVPGAGQLTTEETPVDGSDAGSQIGGESNGTSTSLIRPLVQTAQTENYTVSTAYTEEAEISDNAQLRVVEYDPDDAEYHKACDEAGRSFDWVIDVAFYDGDEEIEPKAPVSISVAANQNDDKEERAERTQSKASAMVEMAASTQTVSDTDEEEQITSDANEVQVSSLGNTDASDSEEDEDTSDTEQNRDASYEIVHFAESGMETVSADLSNDTVTFVVNSLSLLAGGGDGIMQISDTTASSNEGQQVKIPTKPDYSSNTVSAQQTGNVTDSTKVDETLTDVSIAYASDPATSNIENQFNGTSDQDGKVLTDKSVVYGKDDYGAIESYEDGTFGVTLSAMAQEFEYITKETVRTPIDVVFVIDTSRSMDTVTGDNKTRRVAAKDAVNNAIKQIMDNHEANRVGVVTFSSGAWKLMGLGRYTATNDEYLITDSKTFNQGDRNVTGNYITTSSSLSVESGSKGKKYSPDFVGGMYSGTFTQAGIAMAYQVFKDAEGDTVYTARLSDGTTETVTRKPIIVLLSDGDPTYCTTSYSNVLSISTSTDRYGNTTETTNWNGTRYGNGTGGANGNESNDGRTNNKGVLGYYTILSAMYYKQQIASIYYGSDYVKDTIKDAKFYTIGMGINATGTDNSSGSTNSVSGDHYKRTVLNPTSTNRNYLNTATVSDNNIKNDQTAHQLYTLLNKDWGEYDRWGSWQNTTITVSYDATGQFTSAMGGRTYSDIEKPQLTDYPTDNDYSYSDASWFGSKITTEQLKSYFFSVLMWDQGYKSYDLALEKNSSIKVSDTIGTGMEVKEEPVLRLGVKNFSPVSNSTTSTESKDANGNTVVTSVKTYRYRNTQWKYSDIYPDNSSTDARDPNEIIDISGITVTVTTRTTTTGSGNTATMETEQDVVMDVPESLVPVVYPELYGQFYYKELPVRLIYKVGLSSEAVAQVAAADEEETFTFYTNNGAGGGFTKSTVNPYDFDEGSKAKSDNTTDTSENYISSETSGQNVTQTLGNNGKLVIKPSTPKTQLTVKKVWSNGGSHDPITVNIIQTDDKGNGKVYKTVTLSSDNNWQQVVNELPTQGWRKTGTYTYSVEENPVPDGYLVQYHSSLGDDGYAIWTITNTADTDVRLRVVKEWYESDGTTRITDTGGLPEITGTLHRKRLRSADVVTVTLVYSYRQYDSWWDENISPNKKSTWKTVTANTYSVASNSAFSFYFSNVGNATMYYDPDTSDSSVAVASLATLNGSRVANVTVYSGNSVTISVGTNSIYSYNANAPSPSVVFTTDYERPGSGQMEPDNDFSKSFSLNATNDWTQYWTSTDLGEDSRYTYYYWATEDNVPEGYTSTIDYGTENITLTPTGDDKTITITNTENPKYELPETGGAGTLPIELSGSAVMLTAMFVGYSRRRRDRKEGEM